MRQRQFKQLAGLVGPRRLELLVEGLVAIAANLGRLAPEIETCDKAGASGGARLLRNVSYEEAGKFLVLIDACRSPSSTPATISRQFDRAGNHLAKLIYAQMADYSIASQHELLGAIEMHRPALHLDGPNDFDWIFPNRLIAEREGEMYVDLVESEGTLEWVSPWDGAGFPVLVPRPVTLVEAITDTGLLSVDGLQMLERAWGGFDAAVDSSYAEWARRTRTCLEELATTRTVDDAWSHAAFVVQDLWPMPMVELDLSMVNPTVAELQEQRRAMEEAWFAREFGYDPQDGW